MMMISEDPKFLPHSTNFISMFPNHVEKRIRDCGWTDRKTLFLQTKCSFEFPIGTLLIMDYIHGVYYVSFWGCEEVIETMNQEELKMIVGHEIWELKEHKKRIENYQCDENTNMPKESEELRHEPEIERMKKEYGSTFYINTIKKATEIMKKNQIMKNIVGVYWSTIYVIKNYDLLKKYSSKMTISMLSEESKIYHKKMHDHVMNREYHNKMYEEMHKSFLVFYSFTNSECVD